MRRFVTVVAFVAVSGLGSVEAAEDPYAMLMQTLERDESYKVRMQAIRVMSKRLSKSKKPAPDKVVESLGLAANIDESYLVRGMAVVALGVLEDPRGRSYVEQAMKDEEAFVRKQAKLALERLDAAKPPPPPPPPIAPPPPPPVAVGTKRSLVIDAAVNPNVETPPELKAALVRSLSQAFEAKFGQTYRVDDGAGATGYGLTGTIAQRSVEADGAKYRVTLEVSLTIATWPEKNLRQVLKAKASAQSSTNNAAALQRLEAKLLEAAVKRVVEDSTAQIGGG